MTPRDAVIRKVLVDEALRKAEQISASLNRGPSVRDGRGTPIDLSTALAPPRRSIMQRVVDAGRYLISGVGPENWFGPWQPLTPYADQEGPSGARGRRYDFPVGVNLNYQPRAEEPTSFKMLRNLADAYDLLRLVIETRKDQISSFDWNIVPADDKDTGDALKDQANQVRQFLQRPDREHYWDEWSRMLIEDILVIDAGAIYPRMTRGGKLYALDLIDGSTLTPLRDIEGRLPDPPSPAYQQIIKGVPAVDYNADELFYWMRNPRTWKRFGYSPVEQVIVTVNIAMRRQVYQLEYYTEGNIPEALVGVPETWTGEQIMEFQKEFDSMLAGQTAVRQRIKFIPKAETVLAPKDAQVALKDEFDEWLARLVCYAFSLPPISLVKMVNRQAGQQIADSAKEEGLMPFLRWFACRMTDIIQRCLQAPGLKFKWDLDDEVDPKTRAEVHSFYLGKGVLSIDEVREDIGKEPKGFAELVVITPTGPVPMKEAIEQAKKPPEPPPQFNDTARGDGGDPGGGGKPAAPGDGKTPPADEGDAAKGVHVHLGDTYVRVPPAQPPDVNVDIGGIRLNAFGESLKVVRKIVGTTRQPDGTITGTIEERHVDETGAVVTTVHKTLTAKRDDSGQFVGEIVEKAE